MSRKPKALDFVPMATDGHEHDDLLEFADRAGVKMASALGHHRALWAYTGRQCVAGHLPVMSAARLAGHCFWEGDPDVFLDAALSARWLSPHDSGCGWWLEGWDQHAGKAIAKRAKGAERKARHDAKKRANRSSEANKERLSNALPGRHPSREDQDQVKAKEQVIDLQPATRVSHEDRSDRAQGGHAAALGAGENGTDGAQRQRPMPGARVPPLRLVTSPTAPSGGHPNPRAEQRLAVVLPTVAAADGTDRLLSRAELVSMVCQLLGCLDVTWRQRHHALAAQMQGQCTAAHVQEAHGDAMAIAAEHGDVAGVGLVLKLLRSTIHRSSAIAAKGTPPPGQGQRRDDVESFADKHRRQEDEKFYKFVEASSLLRTGGKRATGEGA